MDGKTWVSFPDNQGELRDTWHLSWRFRDEFDDMSLIRAIEGREMLIPLKITKVNAKQPKGF